MQQAEEAADDSRSSVRTVNAAAVVLAAAARSSTGLRPHLQQLHDYHPAAPTQKRRWWSRVTATLCFRPHGHPRRVIAADGDSDTDTAPRPAAAAAAHTASASAYVHQAPPAHPTFAFAAPPSSPASSLFQSESPSPVLLNFHGTSPSPSMFAVGPYARGPQQLVSPPVLYSALTTEPSTAPRTPLATTGASSPEVPFARVLASSGGGEDGLLLYHAACRLRQGSPVPLVSPSPEPICSPSSSSSPQLFHRKLHRRSEGSLLDGHIPIASWQSADARDQDGDDEVPSSAGEFMFGNADGGAEDMDDKNWHFFPTSSSTLSTQPTFNHIQFSSPLL